MKKLSDLFATERMKCPKCESTLCSSVVNVKEYSDIISPKTRHWTCGTCNNEWDKIEK
jgi:hypothetical protein